MKIIIRIKKKITRCLLKYTLYIIKRYSFTDCIDSNDFSKICQCFNKRYRDPKLNENQVSVIRQLNRFELTYYGEKYEEKWIELKHKYKQIRVHFFRVQVLGESIAVFTALLNRDKQISTDELEVFIPYITPSHIVFNRALLDLFCSQLYIVRENESMFWKYVIVNHFNEIDSIDLNAFMSRRFFAQASTKSYKGWLAVPDSINDYGKRRAFEIGIKGEYVCIANRNSNYKERTKGSDKGCEARNFDFNTYKSSVDFLIEHDIQCVKMGRYENPHTGDIKCIDYSGLYAEDKMDIYLFSHCKFLVGGSSGLVLFATLFGRPVLCVNHCPITSGAGGVPYTDGDLYIPKKYYSKKYKRYLSLREISKFDAKNNLKMDDYYSDGIVFVDNSEKEIRDAVEEMYKRLCGLWIETEEEKKTYKRYYNIWMEISEYVISRDTAWSGIGIGSKMAYTYLKNNLYLLD